MADSKLLKTEVTIADGATASDIINISNFSIVGIETPSSMTGTALTFVVGGVSGSTVPLMDTANAAISLTVDATARAYSIDARYTAAFEFFGLVSGSAESGAKVIKIYGYKV